MKYFLVLLILVAAPLFSFAAFTTDLSVGITHPDVHALQEYLNQAGYTVTNYGEETAYFGMGTKDALTRFQIEQATSILGGPGMLTDVGTLNGPTRAYMNAHPTGAVLGLTISPITKDLWPGVDDPDVKVLQQFLNQNGFMVAQTGPGSLGQETTWFGLATQAALARYQEAYAQDILWPQGITKGTGLVYQGTRNHINARMKTTTITPTNSTTPGFSIGTSDAYVNPRARLTLTAQGGVAPYSWWATNGILRPSPLGKTATFIAPRTTGTTSVTITDSARHTASALLTTVAKLVHRGVTTKPSRTITLHPTGGMKPYTYALIEGGGTLTTTGRYTAPAATGTAAVRITDAVGQTRLVHISIGTKATSTPTTTIITITPTSTPQTTATTTPATPMVTLALNLVGAGTIIIAPGAYTCSVSACVASLVQGTTVTLTARPQSGNTFAGWGGACSGLSTTCTVALTAAKSVNATFNNQSVVIIKPNLDEQGWTAPIPTPVVGSTPAERKSLTQYGSRIYYISSQTGDDATGKIYFWNGKNIVDENGSTANASGAVYGTDPMNPSSAVQAFRRWSWVGPRSNGSDIGTAGEVGGLGAKTREGYPDWWLFKRGETFDLTQDFSSFNQANNPAWVPAGKMNSLSLSGGRSVTERQILGAYGDLSLPRPRFVHPLYSFISTPWKTKPIFKNIAYLSLHFDGHDRTSGAGFAGIHSMYLPKESVDLLFEDLWIDGAMGSVIQLTDAYITIRRSLITDSFKTDGRHVQGIFYAGSSTQSVLRVEESILMRNGFSHADPKTFAWPPSGTNYWDIYDRNMYISGVLNPTQSGVFDSVSMIGASGDQFRSGGKIERNFFYQGYVSHGADGGYPDSFGSTGSMLDNVLQNFVGTGTNDNRGQPGWGMNLTSGTANVEVKRNIVTTAQYKPVTSMFTIAPLGWYCATHTFRYATRNNTISGNIFDSTDAQSGMTIVDGVKGESPVGCANWTYPGVTGNTVSNNTFINSKSILSLYQPVGAAASTTNDTVISNNALYKTRAEAAAALGWSGPERTLKTYMQSQGITVTSADGFPEYFKEATKMRRGAWDARWTAKSINNYIRAGFGM